MNFRRALIYKNFRQLKYMQRILKHTQSKDLLLLIILYCLLDSMFLSIPCTSGILSFMNQMHIYIQAKRQRPEYFYLHLHTLKETVQCGKTISKSTHSETPHGALPLCSTRKPTQDQFMAGFLPIYV